jgi:glycosyltransferase involved in cell wall biosynthesis
MEAEIMKNSDVVIVDSPSQRKLWEERGLDKKKGIVLPHGIPKMFDLKDSGKCERIIKRYNLLNSKILFFHGDISHIDGIDILIMATKKLIKKHSAVKVMIVGEGSKNYMNYLKQMIKEEDVRDNFIFTGWVPYVEIPDYISCADIYVAPFRLSHTSNTNIPNKLLEYIAMKKPIVATRSKGIQEMFGNLITYIDPESPDSLSNEILKLINNDRSSEDIDEKKEKLVEVYKWKYITRHEEKIMQSLIKNRNQDFRQFDWQKVIYPNL